MNQKLIDESAKSSVVSVVVLVAVALLGGFAVWGVISYFVGVAADALLSFNFTVVEQFGVGLLVVLVLSVVGKFAKN